MPERRHHAATLKVKTLQSARQPAMRRLLNKCSRISPPPEKDCQTPPGCRMLATQTCSSSRILALPTNGVETSCTREMRSSLVTQVEGCMKFGSHSVKMMYHMIWIDMVASCLESDGNPMEISWKISINCCDSLFLCGMTSKHRSSRMLSHVTVSGTIFTASGTYKLEVMHLDLKGRPNVYIYNVHNVHIFRLVDTTYIHAQTLINRLHMANHIECQFYV